MGERAASDRLVCALLIAAARRGRARAFSWLFAGLQRTHEPLPCCPGAGKHQSRPGAPQNRAESETWGLCELEAQSSPTSPSLQSPANVAAPRAGGRMPVLDAQIGGPLRRSQARSAGPGWPHAAAKGTAPSGPPPNGGGRGALRTPPPGSRTRISMILVSADFEGPGPGARGFVESRSEGTEVYWRHHYYSFYRAYRFHRTQGPCQDKCQGHWHYCHGGPVWACRRTISAFPLPSPLRASPASRTSDA